jgi:hypothetical protein
MPEMQGTLVTRNTPSIKNIKTYKFILQMNMNRDGDTSQASSYSHPLLTLEVLQEQIYELKLRNTMKDEVSWHVHYVSRNSVTRSIVGKVIRRELASTSNNHVLDVCYSLWLHGRYPSSSAGIKRNYTNYRLYIIYAFDADTEGAMVEVETWLYCSHS